MVATTTQSGVEKRAFELYLKRGKINGHDLQDWFAAEKETHSQNSTLQDSAIKENKQFNRKR